MVEKVLVITNEMRRDTEKIKIVSKEVEETSKSTAAKITTIPKIQKKLRKQGEDIVGAENSI